MPGARAFARRVLEDWDVRGRTDDVLLCVSELATNALLHGVPADRGFLLRLLPYAESVRVEVHDSGGGTPAVPDHEPDESGRGLMLVGALADTWGWGAAPRESRVVRVRHRAARSADAADAIASGPTRQHPRSVAPPTPASPSPARH
ncbi:hypothetical protein SHKM778_30070 [Streptomyces sp. KM77-8]|uniref:Histidine kinase/HSP90-like ATPase domain-containing protein n=1 Tax=Streptomyces haneummycinicus TaxID=3074435 RepID=A0AAT9HGX0_9ACTN